MKATIAVCIFTVTGLTGCAAMMPTEETISFSGAIANLTVIKRGCVMEQGQYTDRSGKGKSFPYVKFIAVSNSGETVGEWHASCKAVVPYGTSYCNISGTKKAHFECANYDKYTLVN